jgi:hypothetical protein
VVIATEKQSPTVHTLGLFAFCASNAASMPVTTRQSKRNSQQGTNSSRSSGLKRRHSAIWDASPCFSLKGKKTVGAEIMIDCTVDVSKAIATITKLSAAVKGKATANALNDTIKAANTEAARQIRAEGYNIKSSKIKERIKIKRATTGMLIARLVAIDRPVNLAEYGAKPYGKGGLTRDARGRLKFKEGGGVKARVKRKVTTIPGGFMANGKAYIRLSRSDKKSGGFDTKGGIKFGRGFIVNQEPIRQLLGPGVNQVFANKVIQAVLAKSAKERFPKRFAYWVSRLDK